MEKLINRDTGKSFSFHFPRMYITHIPKHTQKYANMENVCYTIFIGFGFSFIATERLDLSVWKEDDERKAKKKTPGKTRVRNGYWIKSALSSFSSFAENRSILCAIYRFFSRRRLLRRNENVFAYVDKREDFQTFYIVEAFIYPLKLSGECCG